MHMLISIILNEPFVKETSSHKNPTLNAFPRLVPQVKTSQKGRIFKYTRTKNKTKQECKMTEGPHFQTINNFQNSTGTYQNV